jgi:hypothetical protein
MAHRARRQRRKPRTLRWAWLVRWVVGRDAYRKFHLCHLRWRTGDIPEWEYCLKVGKVLLIHGWPWAGWKGRRYIELGLDLAESAGVTRVVPHHVFTLLVHTPWGHRKLLPRYLRAYEIIEQDPTLDRGLFIRPLLCQRIAEVLAGEREVDKARLWAERAAKAGVAFVQQLLGWSSPGGPLHEDRLQDGCSLTEQTAGDGWQMMAYGELRRLSEIAELYQQVGQPADAARVRGIVIDHCEKIAWGDTCLKLARDLAAGLSGLQTH